MIQRDFNMEDCLRNLKSVSETLEMKRFGTLGSDPILESISTLIDDCIIYLEGFKRGKNDE